MTSKNDHNFDDDLALFESQIKQVAAKQPQPQPQPQPHPHPQPHPKPQSKPQPNPQLPSVPATSNCAAPHPSQTRPLPATSASSSVSSPLTCNPTPPSTSAHSPVNETEPPPAGSDISATPVKTSEATHRWFWDGTAWKWLPVASIPRHQPASIVDSVPIVTTTLKPTATASSIGEALAIGPARPPATPSNPATITKRTAAGSVWQDPTLQQWPEDDHRLFVGDLGPDATDSDLKGAFSKYPSFNLARVVKDKRTSVCRGYGFVSFASAHDMLAAIKEMNGKYIGSRPVKLRKSTWQKRSLNKDKWKQVRAFRSISKK